MRKQDKDWNAKKAYEKRTKESAASDEYIHNYRTERQRTAKYDTEQGADLPNSLIKQAKKNQEVKEAASRGEYTTKHRSGQVRTHKLPQEEAINWFNAVIEDPSISDQIRLPLIQANFGMQNAFQLEDKEALTWTQVLAMEDGNKDFSGDQLGGRAGAKARLNKEDDSTPPEDKKKNDSPPPLPAITPENTEPQAYDRKDPTQRRDRRLEDKLVEGRPGERFRLNQQRKKDELRIRNAQPRYQQ